MKAFVPVLVLVSAFAAGPAAAIPRPEVASPSAAREPDLLSAYERGVLRRELVRLQREIVAARRAAAASEELEPFRAALEEARLGGDATNVAAKAQALSDATEAVLYRDESIPGKIQRLQEVGRLLEYDTPREKIRRSRNPPRRTVPPAKPVAEPAPAEAPDATAPAETPAEPPSR